MSDSLGLYLHIPFCKSKCPYCDFFSGKGSEADYDIYCRELKNKIFFWSKKTNRTVSTVYFGGGTPSILGTERLSSLLRTVKEDFAVDKDAEITLEVNPDSGKTLDFALLRQAGFNRVSVGFQTAVPAELKALGRIHHIDFCASLGVKHLSAYLLKIEKGTRFFEIRDSLAVADEDLQADLYLFAAEYLDRLGFRQYEISNFAAEGFESRHNSAYWQCREYIGIGPSAHSFFQGKRFFYGRSRQDFADNILCDDGVGGSEEEYIMLALRLKSGLCFKEYEKRFQKDISPALLSKIQRFKKMGLMESDETHACFTTKGFLVSNAVLSGLLFDTITENTNGETICSD